MGGGGRANKRGKILEDAISTIIEDDYQKVSPSRFFACRMFDQPIYARQCSIGKNLYGNDRKVDLILYHPQKWKNCLVIQCKWQASSGSVEEKYPFEVLSTQLNEFDTIIVLDGNGYSQGAEMWLKRQAGKNKLLYVLTQGDISRFHSQGEI